LVLTPFFENMDEQDPNEPQHYTRSSCLIIPMAGIVCAVLPLCCMGRFQRTGMGVFEGMLVMGVMGIAAAIPLVMRSHIRSAFWSNVVLWLGILGVAVGLSLLLAWKPSLLTG
jgi:hypothetical protein